MLSSVFSIGVPLNPINVVSSKKDMEYLEVKKNSPGVFAIIFDIDRYPF